MELGDGQGYSFDSGEPAWLPFGRGRRKVFQVTACKGLPHLVVCVCARGLSRGHVSPLSFSCQKNILSSVCHTRSKSNVFEEGRLPVFAAP